MHPTSCVAIDVGCVVMGGSCLFLQTVSSIVANAQVMDSFLVFLNPSRATYALQLFPSPAIVHWSPPPNLSPAHVSSTPPRRRAAAPPRRGGAPPPPGTTGGG